MANTEAKKAMKPPQLDDGALSGIDPDDASIKRAALVDANAHPIIDIEKNGPQRIEAPNAMGIAEQEAQALRNELAASRQRQDRLEAKINAMGSGGENLETLLSGPELASVEKGHSFETDGITMPDNRFITYYLIANEEPDCLEECNCETSNFGNPNERTKECTGRAMLARLGIFNSENVKIVTELRTDRLTDRHRLVPMFRNNGRDRNRAVFVQGAPKTYEPIHAPIKMGKPILVHKYWARANQDDEFAEGELNIQALIRDMSRASSPCIAKWNPNSEPGILRIKYC